MGNWIIEEKKLLEGSRVVVSDLMTKLGCQPNPEGVSIRADSSRGGKIYQIKQPKISGQSAKKV